MRNSIADYGETLDEALHRQADELITKLCASYVRKDDRLLAEDLDSVDTTEIQAALDGIDQALQWLNNHEEIVARLGIRYPKDKW